MQESELEADVSDTWGCLAPYYLLSGFVADFRLCQQFTFRFTFGSLVRLGLALSRLPVPSLSADVRGTGHQVDPREKPQTETCRIVQEALVMYLFHETCRMTLRKPSKSLPHRRGVKQHG